MFITSATSYQHRKFPKDIRTNSSEFIDAAPRYWRVFEHYFAFLGFLTSISPSISQKFESRNMTSKAINIFLENYSHVSSLLNITIEKLGDRFTHPDFTSLIYFVNETLKHHTNDMDMDPLLVEAITGNPNIINFTFIKKINVTYCKKRFKVMDEYVQSMLPTILFRAPPGSLIGFLFDEMDTLDDYMMRNMLLMCITSIASRCPSDADASNDTLLQILCPIILVIPI